jgi:hypothetical protein
MQAYTNGLMISRPSKVRPCCRSSVNSGEAGLFDQIQGTASLVRCIVVIGIEQDIFVFPERQGAASLGYLTGEGCAAARVRQFAA